MVRFIVAGGILFGILDGLINANPLALKLHEVYKPIARKSVNLPAGIVIDLVYGFVMAGIFLLLYKSLPGDTGLMKGIGFAILVWFFRVAMQTASTWVMFKVPAATLLYVLVTGFVEMLVLGLFYGWILKQPA
jgi:hypothetical protein